MPTTDAPMRTTSVPSEYAAASTYRSLCPSRYVSSASVENVVYPPRKPTSDDL
jgi:hypothetical protein